jgi:DNA sulfur modification protein DndC
MRLRDIYAELKKPQHRLRKDGTQRKKDGSLSAQPHRLGPLTFEARKWGLTEILSIQEKINIDAISNNRPYISLINEEEKTRIETLIQDQTWPIGWQGNEVTGDIPMDKVLSEGVIQPLLIKNLEGESNPPEIPYS